MIFDIIKGNNSYFPDKFQAFLLQRYYKYLGYARKNRLLSDFFLGLRIMDYRFFYKDE